MLSVSGVILSVTRLAMSARGGEQQRNEQQRNQAGGKAHTQHTTQALKAWACVHAPVDVRESAPITTPPSKDAAMMVVPMDTGCEQGVGAGVSGAACDGSGGRWGPPCLTGLVTAHQRQVLHRAVHRGASGDQEQRSESPQCSVTPTSCCWLCWGVRATPPCLGLRVWCCCCAAVQ